MGKAALWIMACAMPVLAGCNILLPVYEFAENEERAYVNPVGYGSESFCADGTWYQLIKSDAGKDLYDVPAGERLSLSRVMSYTGGNATVSCNAKISFVPEAGEQYILTSYMRGGGCFAEVVRAAPDERTGVLIEPSVDRTTCD